MPSNIDEERQKIDAHIRGLRPLPAGTTNDELSNVVEEFRTIDGEPMRVQRSHLRASRSFDTIALLSGLTRDLYAGSLVRGNAAQAGVLNPIAVPRAGTTLTIAGLQFKAADAVYSSVIDSVSLASVQRAAAAILAQPVAGTTAQFSFSVSGVSSAEHLCAQFGASTSGVAYEAQLGSIFLRSAGRTTVAARVVQPYYVVSVAPLERPSSTFADTVTLADLQVSLGDDVPLYVSEVTYGREFVFLFSASKSSTEIEVSVRAAFGVLQKYDAEAFKRAAAALDTYDVSVIAIGGGADKVVASFSRVERPSSDIAQMISAASSFAPESPGAPLQYRLASLADNTRVHSALVATAEVEQASALRWISFRAEGYTFGDDKEPENNAWIEIFDRSGRRLMWGESGLVRYYERKPWWFPLDREVVPNLTYKALSGARFVFRLDGGGDDWRMNFTIRGKLEDGGDYVLHSHPTEYELNDEHRIEGTIMGV